MKKLIRLINRYCLYLIVYPILWIFSAILISPLAISLVDYAYAERGYSAVGGEWLAIVIIYYASVKLLATIGRWLMGAYD